MTESLDALLRRGLLTPPAGFAARVMTRVAMLPLPRAAGPLRAAARPSRAAVLAEWLGLAGAVVAGMSQAIAFVFGIWFVTGAG